MPQSLSADKTDKGKCVTGGGGKAEPPARTLSGAGHPPGALHGDLLDLLGLGPLCMKGEDRGRRASLRAG